MFLNDQIHVTGGFSQCLHYFMHIMSKTEAHEKEGPCCAFQSVKGHEIKKSVVLVVSCQKH